MWIYARILAIIAASRCLETWILASSSLSFERKRDSKSKMKLGGNNQDTKFNLSNVVIVRIDKLLSLLEQTKLHLLWKKRKKR